MQRVCLRVCLHSGLSLCSGLCLCPGFRLCSRLCFCLQLLSCPKHWVELFIQQHRLYRLIASGSVSISLHGKLIAPSSTLGLGEDPGQGNFPFPCTCSFSRAVALALQLVSLLSSTTGNPCTQPTDFSTLKVPRAPLCRNETYVTFHSVQNPTSAVIISCTCHCSLGCSHTGHSLSPQPNFLFLWDFSLAVGLPFHDLLFECISIQISSLGQAQSSSSAMNVASLCLTTCILKVRRSELQTPDRQWQKARMTIIKTVFQEMEYVNLTSAYSSC